MYDVVIIGAGVIGCAIARELSRYNARTCVVEREEDVCSGTSKANSAIIHSGIDAKPGSMKAKMNIWGNEMMDRVASELDIPFKRNGSLIVCTESTQRHLLDELLQRGEKNGVKGARIISGQELRDMEPNLSDAAVAALYAPSGGIICPFELTLGMAENALDNGTEFRLNTQVAQVEATESGYQIETDQGVIETKTVINAAGVYADVIHRMVSQEPMNITARKGEYCLLDKSTGEHVKRTIFQLPGKMGKGVLVTPTIHGNLLVGPTAVDTENKEGIHTTSAGLGYIFQKAADSVGHIPVRQVITSFAGLRAHEDRDDFIIGQPEDASGFFNVAGIESPGLSSAPAIGVYVAEMVSKYLHLEQKSDFNPIRKGLKKTAHLSKEDWSQLIQEQPAYGHMICRCEMVTEGEIIEAIKRPLGARSLDGVKRRTRAGMGRCQSGFCAPRVMEILAREVPLEMDAITKAGGKSALICGYNKDNI